MYRTDFGRARRFLSAIAAGLLVSTAAARAETFVVADVATGKVLSQKDASARWYPASTTKLMTAYVALKALSAGRAALDTPVVMTRFAANQVPSKMGFQPGSVMRLDMALRMMLVKSANDVAVAIGQAIGGSADGFVEMMNAEAGSLGMRDTRFINPNGLPGPGQFSSAKDLAILAMRLRRDFPAFAEIFGVEAISTGEVLIHNTNTLLGRFDGADGMKTGYICASGFNLVASATRNGRTLVAVVLGAEGPIARDRMAADILEKGFQADLPSVTATIEALPAAGGPPADVSETICSPEGQKARAKERQDEAARPEKTSGSPYLHAVKRPPSVLEVSLGGAAGNAEVEPGIALIADYRIPLPTWRPDPTSGASPAPGRVPPDAVSIAPSGARSGTLKSSMAEPDAGLRGGVTN